MLGNWSNMMGKYWWLKVLSDSVSDLWCSLSISTHKIFTGQFSTHFLFSQRSPLTLASTLCCCLVSLSSSSPPPPPPVQWGSYQPSSQAPDRAKTCLISEQEPLLGLNGESKSYCDEKRAETFSQPQLYEVFIMSCKKRKQVEEIRFSML